MTRFHIGDAVRHKKTGEIGYISDIGESGAYFVRFADRAAVHLYGSLLEPEKIPY
jgi:uncharacterized protein YodC (DUF2158 family)